MIHISEIHTKYCILKPMTIEDSTWLNELFEDLKNIPSLKGLAPFSTSVERTKVFIKSFEKALTSDMGFLYSINYSNRPIGFISVYDLQESPFFSYGLFNEYRRKKLFSGIPKTLNNLINNKLDNRYLSEVVVQ